MSACGTSGCVLAADHPGPQHMDVEGRTFSLHPGSGRRVLGEAERRAIGSLLWIVTHDEALRAAVLRHQRLSWDDLQSPEEFESLLDGMQGTI